MATTTPKQLTPDHRWDDLEREHEILARHSKWRSELGTRIKELEARYGISSDQIHEAIDNGELQETLEVCDWIMDYNLLQHVRTFET